jgi:hypothetical protein
VNPKIALLEQWTELGHSYVLWLVVQFEYERMVGVADQQAKLEQVKRIYS